ncbi:MazG-like family protein [Alicyclobacillus macrosporangiidus]|uniref:MazG-like family protein n=1 Tax=Alicyclobacillus macrosporangiidus TaxID=392015 RepID=A0A1I7HQ04_9BACL|nr:MazG-like family protein [Alicyclobacillus macrosporangiidus]SFU62741.1 MazG-like family protein [Alicyclobacillus macrosporangiidus]
MPQADGPMRIARKLRSIETAKTALVYQVAEVFRVIQSGNEREIAESLGGVVAVAYLLGQQLGVDLAGIDRAACTTLPRALGEDPDHAAGFEHVQRYLSFK